MRSSGDLAILALSSGVVLLSCLLSVSGPEQVSVPVLNRPLPGVCTLKRYTGWDCPGCGMTRSFVSLAHGDWWAAWKFNPASLLFFPLVVLQIPYRAWLLWRAHRGWPRRDVGVWGVALLIVLITTVFGQWLVRTAWQLWQNGM